MVTAEAARDVAGSEMLPPPAQLDTLKSILSVFTTHSHERRTRRYLVTGANFSASPEVRIIAKTGDRKRFFRSE